MRNLFIILLLVVCSGCRPGQTVLKGHIGNYHGEVVRICAEGQSDRRDTLVVDTLGNFIFSPANGVWSIYEISVKDHSPWVPVYIGAGDQVEMKLVLQQDKRNRRYVFGRPAGRECLFMGLLRSKEPEILERSGSERYFLPVL